MGTRRVAFEVTLGELAEVPGTPYAYMAPKSLRDLFEKFPPLDRDLAGQSQRPKIADVKVGLQTSDDFRFTRYWWEVPVDRIASCLQETSQGKKWVPFENDVFLAYFAGRLIEVVNWGNDGEEIKSWTNPSTGRPFSNVWMLRRTAGCFFFRCGLAWSVSVGRSQRVQVRNLKRIPFRLLPEGCIFGVAAHAVFPKPEDTWWILACLTSRLLFFASRLAVAADRMPGAGASAKLPIPAPAVRDRDRLSSLGREAYDLLREWDTGDELRTQFIEPWILQLSDAVNGVWDEATARPVTGHPLINDFEWSNWDSAKRIRSRAPAQTLDNRMSSTALAEASVERESLLRHRLREIQRQIDDEVYRLYGISDEDRALIEAELGEPPDEESDEESDPSNPQEEAPAKELMPAEEHIRRLIHYLAHQSIREDVDGIVPLYDTYKAGGFLERGLAHRVRDGLQGIFGEVALPGVEDELRSALGVPLGDWIESQFFDYHVGLYRLRPIVWELTSRSRGQPAFGCFVYWHKLDADTLRKVQEVYLRPAMETARREADRMASELARRQAADEPLAALRQTERAWRDAEDRADELEQLTERIRGVLQPHILSVQSRSSWVPEKVNEIVAQGYRPHRDYGVRVNIEPLKQAGILAAAANRVKG